MEIPKVGKGKYVLIKSELSTGHILNYDGTSYIGSGNNYFIVKNSIESVEKFIKEELMLNEDIQVIVYDGEGNFIKGVPELFK